MHSFPVDFIICPTVTVTFTTQHQLSEQLWRMYSQVLQDLKVPWRSQNVYFPGVNCM